jgi:hypothetical protein
MVHGLATDAWESRVGIIIIILVLALLSSLVVRDIPLRVAAWSVKRADYYTTVAEEEKERGVEMGRGGYCI